MQTTRPILRRFLASLSIPVLLFVACHLGQETKVEDTLSFTKQYESLSKFDTVRIEVRDESGRTLAIVYHGKVDSLNEIQNLSVPGWDGGPISIVVSGYQAGKSDPVYQEVKQYDGTTRTTGTTKILIHPNPGISAESLLLRVYEGQSIPLPQVDITPPNLAQASLEWSSSNPQVAQVIDGRLVAGIIGSAQLTVKLISHPGKALVFEVLIQVDPRLPASLALDRDTLFLAENGAPQAFGIEIKPSTASSDVVWSMGDSSIAAQRSDGSFQGTKRGKTKVWAASKIRALVRDSAFIVVSEPVSVRSVRFLKDRATLFVGGGPEILAVEVLPLTANPAVSFIITDVSKATLSGDTLRPLAVGTLSVYVHSKEDTSKADSLEITIEVPIPITHLEASDATLTLFVRGETKTVTARAFPATAHQGVRWISLSQSIATVGQTTGIIQPLKPGLAYVVAVSQADSSKRDTILVSVKEDVPVLSVGNDTTVAAGQTVTFLPIATQEYGKVVMYKWDLDGNLLWDDSANAISSKSFQYALPKEYGARFYVRDTEGNEVIKTCRITVVSGATVAISLPADNFHTNQKVVTVEWSVNGKSQDSLTSHSLSEIGPNTITRTARDSAGKEYSHSITVHYDTTAPSMPNIAGTSPTNVKPRWSWSSGGGGSGDFRFRLGDGNFPTAAPSVRDTMHTLVADPVSGTTYTLFVQERDLAGNWSTPADLAISYNVTQPVVVIQSPRASGTHFSSVATVALNGTATGPVAISKVTYKVGSGVAVNATFASGSWSTPALDLLEGAATVVIITATDIANNTGEATVSFFHDNTPPSVPVISNGPSGSISVLKGTFAWSAGEDEKSGSGLNGRYRYSINNGPWKDTAATLLTDLVLPEGNVVFSVQEQDRALNWSASATRVFKADTTPPVINLTSHANPYSSSSLSITIAGQVLDSISGVATMTVSGQLSGSGTVQLTGSSWSTTALNLATGSNTLVLSAVDLAGNTRRYNIVVNVNIPAPRVVITNPSDNNKLTQNDTIYVHYTIDGVPGRQSYDLIERANSLVVSSDPNTSGNIGRDTVIVTRDATQPLAPTLSRGLSPTNGNATWTWISRGDNAGGAGMRNPAKYRYSLNGSGWMETEATGHEVADTGTFSIVVQEQDRAGNWSINSATQTVVVDRVVPNVVITWPSRDDYVTSRNSIFVQYRVDSGEVDSAECLLLESDGRNSCRINIADAAGNTGRDSINVFRRWNVVFVTQNGSGLKNGIDWENALDRANLGVAVESPSLENRTFWLGTGTYANLNVRYSDTLLGGFDASTFPYFTQNRNKTASSLGSLNLATGVVLHLDGFSIPFVSGGHDVTLTMTDITISPSPGGAVHALYFPYSNSKITANNVVIDNGTYSSAPVEVTDGVLTFNGGSISGNTIGENMPMWVGGRITLVHPFVINGNINLDPNAGSYRIRLLEGGVLSVDSRMSLSCEGAAREVLIGSGGICTYQ